MIDAAQELLTSMLSAYAGYVERCVRELGVDRPPSFERAVAEGRAWLEQSLEALLVLPFAEQRRGPLEVFQEAMRFPTDSLAEAGIEPLRRDPGAVAALPGDLFSLAPASSRRLGDEVWSAHLAWGVEKAKFVQPSRWVGLLSTNLMDRSRIEQPVERSGAKLVVWPAWVEGTVDLAGLLPQLVLIDLSVPDALTAIEALVRAGVRVIAYGPHVNRDALRSAGRLGAEEVLARSVFFEKLADFFS